MSNAILDNAAETVNAALSLCQKKCRAGVFANDYGTAFVDISKKEASAIFAGEIEGATKIEFREASRCLPNSYKGGDATWITLTLTGAHPADPCTVTVGRSWAPKAPHGRGPTSRTCVWISESAPFPKREGWRRDLKARTYSRN